jgi:apolipoprotein N-acyltransferase
MTFKDRNGEFPSLDSSCRGIIGAFLILFGFFWLFIAVGQSNMVLLTNDPFLKFMPALFLFLIGGVCIWDARK